MRRIFLGCVLVSIFGGNVMMNPIAQSATQVQEDSNKYNQKINKIALNVLIKNIAKKSEDIYILNKGGENTADEDIAVQVTLKAVQVTLKKLKEDGPSFFKDIEELIQKIGSNPTCIFKQINALRRLAQSYCEFGDLQDYIDESKINKADLIKILDDDGEDVIQKTLKQTSALIAQQNPSQKLILNFKKCMRKCLFKLSSFIYELNEKYIYSADRESFYNSLRAAQWEAEMAKKNPLVLEQKDRERMFFVRNLFITLSYMEGQNFNDFASDTEWMTNFLGLTFDWDRDEQSTQIGKFRRIFLIDLVVGKFGLCQGTELFDYIKEDKIDEFIPYVTRWNIPLTSNLRKTNDCSNFACLPDAPNVSILDFSVLCGSKCIFDYLKFYIKSLQSSFWPLCFDPEIINFYEKELSLETGDRTQLEPFVISAGQVGYLPLLTYFFDNYANIMDEDGDGDGFYKFLDENNFITLSALYKCRSDML